MSRSRAEDHNLRSSTLARGVQVDLFLFVPVTVLVWILAPELVSLAFRRGLFGHKDVLGTTPLLRVGTLSVLPSALFLLLRDYFYTSGRTRPLMWSGLIQLVTTGIANGFLALRYGLVWVPWGLVAGIWISCLLLFHLARARNPEVRVGLSIREVLSLVVAGGAAAGVSLIVQAIIRPRGDDPLSATLVFLAVAGSLGCATYLLVAFALRHPLAVQLRERLRGAR